MKVAYIAGPYRAYKKDGGFDLDKMFSRTMKMREAARWYWKKGYACISPLLNSFMLDSDELEDSVWINGDMELISRCDVIIMTKGWEDSKGSCAELEHAQSLGLEVIYDEGATES